MKKAKFEGALLIAVGAAMLVSVGCTSAPDVETHDCSTIGVECNLSDDTAGWGYQSSGCRAPECFCGATCGTNEDCDTGCCVRITNTSTGATIGYACAPACECGL